jgi:threonine aldolase
LVAVRDVPTGCASDYPAHLTILERKVMAAAEEILAQCDNVLPGHGPVVPIARRLREIADSLGGEERQDVYGVGEYLQSFESEAAGMFGKQAAVFMPSGTMAQQIALRIWCDRRARPTVAMHPTSHLEFAEHNGYQFLHDIHRIQFGAPEQLRQRLVTVKDLEGLGDPPGMLLLELPCRPLGGQLPTWEELLAIRDWAASHAVPMHLDGARIWSCRGFYDKSFAEIAALFDSVYVSFYKDLGGLCGCMLMGDADFIVTSRLWQRRYGGNLYTQAPFVASARLGLAGNLPQMERWVARAREIATILGGFPAVRVNPDPPQVNFFQLFIEGDHETLTARHQELAKETGTYLFHRMGPSPVPGIATTEMHMFGNAMRFDTGRLAPFLERLLAPG